MVWTVNEPAYMVEVRQIDFDVCEAHKPSLLFIGRKVGRKRYNH